MYLEAQNLNDHKTLDMVQGNRKDKDRGRDSMTQAVNKDFVKELFQSLDPSFQMHKHDKEIANPLSKAGRISRKLRGPMLDPFSR